MNRTNRLVSVILPTYNCENFIKETLDSVLKQTFKEWELIIVDDCSTDGTIEILNEYKKNDHRIKLYSLKQNNGAAIARNLGVKHAKGNFIAFLDSDDLWNINKLELQINFMIDNNYSFTCTSYNKIDENGASLDRVVKWDEISSYEGILKKNPGNSTVIYNAGLLGKIEVPHIRKRNDYLMWLQVIKKAERLFSLNKILTSHRIRRGSLSSNKFDLVKYHWIVYRKHENLSIFKSMYLVVYWSFITVFKLR